MHGSDDPEREELARRLESAGWQVVTEIHSRAGVELLLHPALHVWDFPYMGQRFAYGRDDKDALRSFLRQREAAQANDSQPAERGVADARI